MIIMGQSKLCLLQNACSKMSVSYTLFNRRASLAHLMEMDVPTVDDCCLKSPTNNYSSFRAEYLCLPVT